jgi:hypothetical protein
MAPPRFSAANLTLSAGFGAVVHLGVGGRKGRPAGGGRPCPSRIEIVRRWVFALLLLVVPFQLVWGAAAPYCAHEASTSAKKHFGHHEHKHQAGDEIVSATDDADVTAGAFHADCESCHLGSSAFMPAVTAAVDALPHGSASNPPDPRYDSHIPAGPQRPDRPHPAPAARFGGGVVVVSVAD